MALAPLVGLLLGGAGAAMLAGAVQVTTGDLLPCALAVAALALLTRGLHLDGLSETPPTGSGPTRRQRQGPGVVERPDVGALGLAAVVLVLLVQVAALLSCVATGRRGRRARARRRHRPPHRDAGLHAHPRSEPDRARRAGGRHRATRGRGDRDGAGHRRRRHRCGLSRTRTRDRTVLAGDVLAAAEGLRRHADRTARQPDRRRAGRPAVETTTAVVLVGIAILG